MKIATIKGEGSEDAAFSLVMQHSQSFTPAVLPPGVRRGKAGRCYENAARFILDHLEGPYRYVEGFAFNSKAGSAFRHAWITSGDAAALDLTLPEEQSSWHEYVGLSFGNESLGRLLVARGYFGLLDPVDELVLRELHLHPPRIA